MSWARPKNREKGQRLSLTERNAVIEQVYQKMENNQRAKDIATALSRNLAETLKGLKPRFVPYAIAVSTHVIRRYVAMKTYEFMTGQVLEVEPDDAEEQSTEKE
jgi:hypothetical protein